MTSPAAVPWAASFWIARKCNKYELNGSPGREGYIAEEFNLNSAFPEFFECLKPEACFQHDARKKYPGPLPFDIWHHVREIEVPFDRERSRITYARSALRFPGKRCFC